MALLLFASTAESKRKAAPKPDVPTGTVIAFAGDVEAGNEPPGWLLCDGRRISTAKFKALFDVLQGRYGRVDAAGGTFALPDYRGVFLRGVAHGSQRDPDRDSRQVHTEGASGVGDLAGTRQDGEVQAHSHLAPVGAGGRKPGKYVKLDVDPNAEGISPGVSTESTGGRETRPINVSVNYLIRSGL